MNREKMVWWLKFITNNGKQWPLVAHDGSPVGWKWIVSNLPYQPPEIILISLDLVETISKQDVTKHV